MKISFQCHNCGKAVSTSSEHAGKKTKCPGCQTQLVIPAAAEVAPVEPADAPVHITDQAGASPKIWHYVENGAGQGPVTEEELRALQQKGNITPATLIWKEGMSDWLPAGQVMPCKAPASQPPAVPGQANPEVYCRNCGKPVREKAVVCPSCGCAPQSGKEFCRHCGKPTASAAVVCLSCGGSLSGSKIAGNIPEKQMTAFLLCLFLSVVAGHRFYLKNENAVVMLLVSIFTFGLGGSIWGLIDIMHIAKGDFCDGEGTPVGAPVPWMITIAWVCTGCAILGGVMILLSGCAAILGA